VAAATAARAILILTSDSEQVGKEIMVERMRLLHQLLDLEVVGVLVLSEEQEPGVQVAVEALGLNPVLLELQLIMLEAAGEEHTIPKEQPELGRHLQAVEVQELSQQEDQGLLTQVVVAVGQEHQMRHRERVGLGDLEL
jgi:hypothetical protein